MRYAEGSEAPLPRRSALVIAALGVVLAAATVAVALENTALGDRELLAATLPTTVLVPIGVGIFAWRRPASVRFGQLLVVTGLCSFAVALGAATGDVPYSVGRLGGWILEVLVVCLFLSYPSGRLPATPERVVVALFAGTVAVLYLPTALFIDQYPQPWLTCTDACPGNAFQLVGSEPGFLDQVLVPVRTVLTFAFYGALLGVVLNRIRRASLPMRLGLTPVFAAAALRTGLVVTFLVLRDAGVGDSVLEGLAALVLLSVPLAAIGFLVGLVRWQVHAANALQGLADGPEPSAPQGLQERLRESLHDPSLDLYVWAAGGWQTAGGEPAALPRRGGRCVIEVAEAAEPVAAIACDPALHDHRELVEAAGSWVRAVLVRHRLVAALDGSLRDLEASGRRLAVAAATERRRIERDLHDGAQQQLVTLRVKLQMAEDAIADDPERSAELFRDLAARVDEVIDEVRSLARGIYPALLADAGIGDAVRAAGRRSELDVAVSTDGLGRYPVEIENAVYFCCLEALQNAAKHGEASRVDVEFTDDGTALYFEVRDDGRGFQAGANGDRPTTGAGLTNMRDRIAAVGGALVVRSRPGAGTIVAGSVRVAGAPARSDGDVSTTGDDRPARFPAGRDASTLVGTASPTTSKGH